MSSVYQLLPELTKFVRNMHKEFRMQHGHGFDSHVYRVASLALKFGDELGVGRLAAAAGLCHNTDRLLAHLQRVGRMEIPPEEVKPVVFLCLHLGGDTFTEEEGQAVVSAVLNHGLPNDDADDAVTIALKDADRVVNAARDVVIRSGQFHADLPVIDFDLLLNDERGKYNGRLTVVADLVDCLDWAKPGPFGVRTELAKQMIRRRVERLREFLVGYVEEDLREEGILPFEFTDDKTA